MALQQLCLLMLVVLGLLAPGELRAHATLIEALPADGAVLPTAPDLIELRFNEPVRPLALRLLNAAGAVQPHGLLPSPDGLRLQFRPTGALPNGAYVLSWRVTSLDSHIIAGALGFAIGADHGPVDTAALVPPPDPVWRVALGLARALQDGLLLLAVGSVLLASLVPSVAQAAYGLRRLTLTAGIAGLGATIARLGLLGLDATAAPASTLLTPTPWRLALELPAGAGLLVAGLGLLLVVVGCHLARDDGHPARLFAWPGAAFALVSLGLAGHAAAIQPVGLGPPLLVLHLACAAAWIGGIALIPLALRTRGDAAGPAVDAFSRAALVTVPCLLIAGFALAWMMVGAPENLAGTAYGGWLLAKLALVLGLLGVGAVNLLLLGPRLHRRVPNARAWLQRALALDAVLVVAILAVTAGLVSGPPPRLGASTAPVRTDHAGHAAPHDAPARGRTVHVSGQGYQALLTIVPGGSGRHRLELAVATVAGAPFEPRDVTVGWSLPDAEVAWQRRRAELVGHGNFAVADANLLPPGHWQFRIDLLVDDFTKVRLETALQIE